MALELPTTNVYLQVVYECGDHRIGNYDVVDVGYHFVAFVANAFHRVSIVRRQEDHFTVCLIDFGKFDQVCRSALHRLGSEFTTLPAQAIKARLCGISVFYQFNLCGVVIFCLLGYDFSGVPESSDELAVGRNRMFQSLTEGRVFCSYVIKENDGSVEVELIDTSGPQDIVVGFLLP